MTNTSANTNSKKLTKTEFVPLMALMTSLIALSIDGMLPALPLIGQDFSAPTSSLPLIISMLFLGFGFGQLVFGPLSDAFGRKPPIHLGIACFIIGSALSGFATSMTVMLIGRILQGFGGASPRIVSLALIRDEYSGNAMAQITSFVMTVFILVPAVAPGLGQLILYIANWRAIFILLSAVALITWAWFHIRQHETLEDNQRKPLSITQLIKDTKEVFSYPTTVACMILSGLVFGIFVGYLGSVQEIFEQIFGVKELFPLFFAILSLSIGGASLFNARVVLILGMRKLISSAFKGIVLISSIFLDYLTLIHDGHPSLQLFMTYMILTFFAVGFLFGNLNAMAMEPLGHIAGIGSAILGFMQSLIAVAVGTFLGFYLHGSVTPLVASFGIISFICLGVLYAEQKYKKAGSLHSQ